MAAGSKITAEMNTMINASANLNQMEKTTIFIVYFLGTNKNCVWLTSNQRMAQFGQRTSLNSDLDNFEVSQSQDDSIQLNKLAQVGLFLIVHPQKSKIPFTTINLLLGPAFCLNCLFSNLYGLLINPFCRPPLCESIQYLAILHCASQLILIREKSKAVQIFIMKLCLLISERTHIPIKLLMLLKLLPIWMGCSTDSLWHFHSLTKSMASRSLLIKSKKRLTKQFLSTQSTSPLLISVKHLKVLVCPVWTWLMSDLLVQSVVPHLQSLVTSVLVNKLEKAEKQQVAAFAHVCFIILWMSGLLASHNECKISFLSSHHHSKSNHKIQNFMLCNLIPTGPLSQPNTTESQKKSAVFD
ncbi:hypothetical protein VP01_3274g2 [Puccinia sorghi]|uniref:Uncharacterized protein n=1 Tax=Puccinia sorghi TaxID=27349 RepID=A0A0L6UXS8_9BASI|nr:hypothetical protein VP01_3274g2 [Puccinia sorghi]